MPDYTHLLEIKLSPSQKHAINLLTETARAHAMTIYLTGGAVRDIVSGSSIRDVDISVQGDAQKLRKDLERSGFVLTGEHAPSKTLFFEYPPHTRIELSSTRREVYPRPGRVEYHPAGILDDLRRRDFTCNAMALSLNEGSYGLMLDPLNGAADILSQHLRLASNYGFLDDPVRLVRAARFMARTGWVLEERTQVRYDHAKAEGVISNLTTYQRGYELEEIAYEEDALVILKALEAEGWMKHLFPAWTHRVADASGLQRLHEAQVRLMMAGLHPEASAAAFTLLTAKMQPSQTGALKKLFPRDGLLKQVAALDRDAKALSKQLLSKEAARPSHTWKLLHSVQPEAALWLLFTGKGAALHGRFEGFFSKWSEARQKVPYAILQEMRIRPEMDKYAEVLEKLTFALMDGELETEAALREFLLPFSPPAPPSPTVVRRPRAPKHVEHTKEKKPKAVVVAAAETSAATPQGEGIAAAAEVAHAGASVAPTGNKAAVPDSQGGKQPHRPVAASSAKTDKTVAKVERPAATKAAETPAAKEAAKQKTDKARQTTSRPEEKKAPVAKEAARKPAKKTTLKTVKTPVAKSASRPAAGPIGKAHTAPKGPRTVPSKKKAQARPAPAKTGQKKEQPKSTPGKKKTGGHAAPVPARPTGKGNAAKGAPSAAKKKVTASKNSKAAGVTKQKSKGPSRKK